MKEPKRIKRTKPPRIQTASSWPMNPEFSQRVDPQMPPWSDTFSDEQFQRTLRRVRQRQEAEERQRLVEQREPLFQFYGRQLRRRDQSYYQPEMLRLENELRRVILGGDINRDPTPTERPFTDRIMAQAAAMGARRNRARAEPVRSIDLARQSQMMRPRNRRV